MHILIKIRKQAPPSLSGEAGPVMRRGRQSMVTSMLRGVTADEGPTSSV